MKVTILKSDIIERLEEKNHVASDENISLVASFLNHNAINFLDDTINYLEKNKFFKGENIK